jgi:hypothetical protein
MIRYHADFLDQEKDFKEMKNIIFMTDPDKKLGLKLKTYEYLEDCLNDAHNGDVVILDWGGLSLSGVSGFLNSYERTTEKAIQDKPSVTFVFWETMEGYYDETFYQYPNVKSIGRTSSLKEFEKLFKSLT